MPKNIVKPTAKMRPEEILDITTANAVEYSKWSKKDQKSEAFRRGRDRNTEANISATREVLTGSVDPVEDPCLERPSDGCGAFQGTDPGQRCTACGKVKQKRM